MSFSTCVLLQFYDFLFRLVIIKYKSIFPVWPWEVYFSYMNIDLSLKSMLGLPIAPVFFFPNIFLVQNLVADLWAKSAWRKEYFQDKVLKFSFEIAFVENKVLNVKEGHSFLIKFETLLFSCSFSIMTHWFFAILGCRRLADCFWK